MRGKPRSPTGATERSSDAGERSGRGGSWRPACADRAQRLSSPSRTAPSVFWHADGSVFGFWPSSGPVAALIALLPGASAAITIFRVCKNEYESATRRNRCGASRPRPRRSWSRGRIGRIGTAKSGQARRLSAARHRERHWDAGRRRLLVRPPITRTPARPGRRDPGRRAHGLRAVRGPAASARRRLR